MLKEYGGIIMKKLTALCCAMVVLTSGVAAFGGCGKAKEEAKNAGTVMNVSLNPEVEFVLDADNKVVSVNALNEEGNLIISSATFTGKTADEAVELFVQISDETGFLFEGEIKAGENQLSVSISGDKEKAKALYNSVAEKANAYFAEADISAKIEQGKAITEEQLQALVAECAPYIDEAKVEALSYMELVETIAESRKETAEMYSQEVKNAYYEAKAFAMQQAEYETIKSHLNAMQQLASDAAFGIYTGLVETIETTRLTMLVNEDSPYQIALKAFQEAKIEYLNYREYIASLEQNEITTEISAMLANYQMVLDNTETALINAGKKANEALDTAKAQAATAYDKVITAIGDYAAMADEYAAEISTSATEAQTKFFTQFETDYKASIAGAKQSWADMKAALEADVNNTESAE
jgi:hypothetical protein